MSKGIDDLIKDIGINEFEKWRSIIESESREICNDKTIELKADLNDIKRFDFSFHPKNDKQIECVKKAILKHIEQMPYPFNEIFKDFVTNRLAKREDSS